MYSRSAEKKALSRGYIYGPVAYPEGPRWFACCCFCKTYFKNINSIYQHNCQNRNNYMESVHTANKELILLVVHFISECNVSLSTTVFQQFRNILQLVNPIVRGVTFKTIRESIFQELLRIENLIKLNSVGPFASLLIEGAKKGKKEFYGIVLFTNNKLTFLKLKRFLNSDNSTIADAVSDVIQLLANNQIKIVFSLSDNTSNLKRSFSDTDIQSVQQKTGQRFFWSSCTNVCLSLTNDDTTNMPELRLFMQNIERLLKLINQHFDIKLWDPLIMPTRWGSLATYAKYINEHLLQITFLIQNQINQNNQKIGLVAQSVKVPKFKETMNAQLLFQNNELGALNEFLNSNLFTDAFQSLLIVKEYMTKFESDLFPMNKLYPEINSLKKVLKSQQSPFSQKLFELFKSRSNDFNSMALPLTCFIFSSEGLKWYRDKSFDRKVIINQQIHPMALSAAEYFLPQFSKEEVIEQLGIYLDVDATLPSTLELKKIFEQIPLSKSAVERMLCHLNYIFGSKNNESSDDIIENELKIRLESIFMRVAQMQ